MNIFLVEDDSIITEGLTAALSSEGYQIDASGSMNEALEKWSQGAHYDVCLLDVMLPDGDGYQICRKIRETSDVPILFLTACDDEIHTVLALEQGADDYIAKPFRIRELLARIRAILRRSRKTNNSAVPDSSVHSLIRIGRNELNLETGRLMRDGEEVFLSAVEYRLLLAFARSRGQVLTRAQILNDMWDAAGDFVNDNTLSVYVGRLRKKLETETDIPLIETVRGIGYRMVITPEEKT